MHINPSPPLEVLSLSGRQNHLPASRNNWYSVLLARVNINAQLYAANVERGIDAKLILTFIGPIHHVNSPYVSSVLCKISTDRMEK